MGGCSSKPVPDQAEEGKPLNEWTAKEVEGWYKRLPKRHDYSSILLPEAGAVVAVWTKEELVAQGVPELDAARLLTYRDQAAAGASCWWGTKDCLRSTCFGCGGGASEAPTPGDNPADVVEPGRPAPAEPHPEAAQAECPLPFDEKPLAEWSEKDVEQWWQTEVVSDLRRHHDKLLPDRGVVVASWTKEDLVGLGVPPRDAHRIIVYRDQRMPRGGGGETAGEQQEGAGGEGGGAPDAEVPPAAAAGAREGSAQAGTAGGGDGGRGPAVAPASTKSETAITVLKWGIIAARRAVEKYGPGLPPPGPTAAALVLQLFDMMDTAIANHANLKVLQERVVGYMDMLAAYRATLDTLRYRQSVTSFEEVLKGVCAYVREYRGRNVVLRLLKSGGDKEAFEGFVAELDRLIRDVTAGASLDNSDKLREIRAMLDKPLKFQDPSAEARALLVRLGGMEAVARDPAKLQQVVAKLDVGDRVTIEVLTSVVSTHFDKGPQRLIYQPELRLFWKEFYNGVPEVSWQEWWGVFPQRLSDLRCLEPSTASKLAQLLGSDVAHEAFKRAVDQGQLDDKLGAWELSKAFSGDEELVVQVERIVVGTRPDAAARLEARAAAQGGPAPAVGEAAAAVAAGAAGAAAVQPSDVMMAAEAGVAFCQLPHLSEGHISMQQRVDEVAEHLKEKGSVLLLGPSGCGKSSLAADVGWRLVKEKKLPGGALWVDLRGATSDFAVEARFCTALGLPLDVGNRAQVVEALSNLASSKFKDSDAMEALVIVDSIEGALGSDDAAAALLSIAQQVTNCASGIRMLFTSPTDGPSTGEHLVVAEMLLHLKTILHLKTTEDIKLDLEAAKGVIRAASGDATLPACERVAGRCAHLPLPLRMVAEAVRAGRLTLQDVLDLHSGPTEAAPPGKLVRLVLRSYEDPVYLAAAAQLAVFPSSFDEQAAAEVLDMPLPKARGVLSVLRMRQLVQACGAQQGRRLLVPAVVREEAVAADEQAARQGVGRFVRWMLQQLGQWGRLYRARDTWRSALSMARDHLPDLGKLLQLLEQGPAGGSSVEGGDRVGEAAGAGRTPAWVDLEVAEALDTDVVALLRAVGALQRLKVPIRAVLVRLEAATRKSADRRLQRRLQAGGARVRCVLVGVAAYCQGEPLGDATAAEDAWEEACRALGPSHPLTAWARHLLGQCKYAASDGVLLTREEIRQLLREARGHFAAALQVRQQALGADHPDTAQARWLLAASMNSCGEHQQARGVFSKALQALRTTLGEEHPDTATATGQYASCLRDLGELHEAYNTQLWALGVRERELGAKHTLTALSQAALARCLEALGGADRVDRAVQLHARALEVLKEVLGDDHERTVRQKDALQECERKLERARMTPEERRQEDLRRTALLRKVLAAWRARAGLGSPPDAAPPGTGSAQRSGAGSVDGSTGAGSPLRKWPSWLDTADAGLRAELRLDASARHGGGSRGGVLLEGVAEPDGLQPTPEPGAADADITPASCISPRSYVRSFPSEWRADVRFATAGPQEPLAPPQEPPQLAPRHLPTVRSFGRLDAALATCPAPGSGGPAGEAAAALERAAYEDALRAACMAAAAAGAVKACADRALAAAEEARSLTTDAMMAASKGDSEAYAAAYGAYKSAQAAAELVLAAADDAAKAEAEARAHASEARAAADRLRGGASVWVRQAEEESRKAQEHALEAAAAAQAAFSEAAACNADLFRTQEFVREALQEPGHLLAGSAAAPPSGPSAASPPSPAASRRVTGRSHEASPPLGFSSGHNGIDAYLEAAAAAPRSHHERWRASVTRTAEAAAEPAARSWGASDGPDARLAAAGRPRSSGSTRAAAEAAAAGGQAGSAGFLAAAAAALGGADPAGGSPAAASPRGSPATRTKTLLQYAAGSPQQSASPRRRSRLVDTEVKSPRSGHSTPRAHQ